MQPGTLVEGPRHKRRALWGEIHFKVFSDKSKGFAQPTIQKGKRIGCKNGRPNVMRGKLQAVFEKEGWEAHIGWRGGGGDFWGWGRGVSKKRNP